MMLSAGMPWLRLLVLLLTSTAIFLVVDGFAKFELVPIRNCMDQARMEPSMVRPCTTFFSTQLFQTPTGSNDGSLHHPRTEPPLVVGGSRSVTLKVAFDSAWGVADLSENKSERFTCDESLDMVHRLRRTSHAILVGRTTVERDDCTLTIRRGVPLQPKSMATGLGRHTGHPVRVILDPTLSLDRTKYRIFKDGLPTLVYHGVAPELMDNETSIQKVSDTVELIYLPPQAPTSGKDSTGVQQSKRLSPRAVCQHLSSHYEIHHVMVEGGPQTARLFLEDGDLVDRAILVFAPLCFKEPLMSGMSHETLKSSGLALIQEGLQGVDRFEHWKRPDATWPEYAKKDADEPTGYTGIWP